MNNSTLANTPRVFPSGPQPAEVLIVGEAPGEHEIRLGEPFVGASGSELTNMLHQVGLVRAACRITNVTPFRPPKNDIKAFFYTKTEGAKQGAPWVQGRFPSKEILLGLEELKAEVAKTRPSVIIALGDTALWALTGESGITKWRGSELSLKPVWEGPYDSNIRVIPTYHPAAILRAWDWRAIACSDIAKAARPRPEEPKWDFAIPETYPEARQVLEELLAKIDASPSAVPLSCDIETRERRVIDCIGFGTGLASAVTIPFMRASDYSFLFTPEEEADLIILIRQILLHPRTFLIGQNFLYDAQYISRLWGFLPEPSFDTMIAHAVAYPGTQKSLDYLSSIYLPWHRYWKGESGEAEATADDHLRWQYNAKDCCTTWALYPPIMATINRHSLSFPLKFEMDIFRPLILMMMKGVRQDNDLRSAFRESIMYQQSDIEAFFVTFTEEALEGIQLAKSKTAKDWWRSPQQQSKLFYEVFKLPVQKHKVTKRPTMDDAAMVSLGKSEPLFLPLFQELSDYRSLGVFLSTFVLVRLDHDGRMRCSYNPVGTETFRFNSAEDVFGFGGNLQNIPGGK